MTLTGFSIHFFFTDLSKQFSIYLVVFSLKLFIDGSMGSGVSNDSNQSHQSYKIKSHNPQPKQKTRHFQNVIRKRLLRDIN